jgi:hypothetical protein
MRQDNVYEIWVQALAIGGRIILGQTKKEARVMQKILIGWCICVLLASGCRSVEKPEKCVEQVNDEKVACVLFLVYNQPTRSLGQIKTRGPILVMSSNFREFSLTPEQRQELTTFSRGASYIREERPFMANFGDIYAVGCKEPRPPEGTGYEMHLIGNKGSMVSFVVGEGNLLNWFLEIFRASLKELG